jgi:DNA-binding transcriptional MerR regulator
MSYTVKQLAKMAGVSARTLYFYDQVGLLKPAQYGENGYRYYDDADLLRLQQILFYKELDFRLDEIRAIISAPDFDLAAALQGHKAALQKRAERLAHLIHTIDHTLQHLKGKVDMSKKQFFEGFNEEQEAQYEKEAMQMYDPETVKASYKRWKSYTAADKQRIGEEGNAVYEAFLAAIPLGPASPQAQAAVVAWRKHMDYFWSPDDEQLLGLTDLYNDDPRFRKNYDRIDPRLAEFIRESVKVYVEGRKK